MVSIRDANIKRMLRNRRTDLAVVSLSVPQTQYCHSLRMIVIRLIQIKWLYATLHDDAPNHLPFEIRVLEQVTHNRVQFHALLLPLHVSRQI
jgi:hypothetical protein